MYLCLVVAGTSLSDKDAKMNKDEKEVKEEEEDVGDEEKKKEEEEDVGAEEKTEVGSTFIRLDLITRYQTYK